METHSSVYSSPQVAGMYLFVDSLLSAAAIRLSSDDLFPITLIVEMTV